jgi:hypothetical protein
MIRFTGWKKKICCKEVKMINNINKGYVEVSEEPIHLEIFKNESFRVYIATIPSGASTLYHRHSEDTVYVVLEGGLIRNENFNDYNKSKVQLPKSVRLLNKIYLGLQSIFARYVNMPDTLFFLMANKNNECIHRAVTSNKNTRYMKLMGIEIYSNATSLNPIILHEKSFKKEFNENNYSVISLSLKQNEKRSIDQSMASCLIVCLKGIMDILFYNDQVATKNILNESNYLAIKSSDKMVFTNSEKEKTKILIIVMK